MRPLRGLLGRLVRRRPPRVRYAPSLDGRADPGEVVWAWVPFEESPHEGKDRPVLVVGREGSTLLGLPMSTNLARNGRPGWLPLGPGAWDREGRQSLVNVGRVLRLREDAVRREASVLDRRRFEAVAEVLRREHGWR